MDPYRPYSDRLPCRIPPECGGARWPRAIDWLTRTWFRFNAAMLSILFLAAAFTDPRHDSPPRAMLMFFAVPAAVGVLPLVALSFWLVSLIPVIGDQIIIARRLYYRVFCRFVVEPVPPRVFLR